MKLACFTLTYWKDQADANSKSLELRDWKAHIEKMLKPDVMYIACGTKSEPVFSPIDVPVINSGVEYTVPYDAIYWCYSLCAENAGMWHALLNTDCDILGQIATDCFIKDDLLPILEEFNKRPELVCAPSWASFVEDAAIFYKRSALVKYLNMRIRPNLIAERRQPPLMTEQEKAQIFRGQWWNPWPNIVTMRQEWYVGVKDPIPDERVLSEKWPIVLRPSETIKKLYRSE